MEKLVAWNVSIKAAIVHEDPFEKSVRALLNFGHTFGHAIENVLEYSGILHGEGVSLGMVAAGRLAAQLNLFSPADLQKLITFLNAVGLPTAQKDLDVDRIFSTMFTDKKVLGGKLRLVLPTRIGDARVVTDVPENAVRQAIASLR